MPESLRAMLRTPSHPARIVACPHCKARPGKPCQLRKSGRFLSGLHPERTAIWAQATAVCPACQVTPGIPCHDDSRPFRTVHARRITEAEETAA
ncbi:zinc finger domain-containing protein [Streptomyces sp. NPDC004376]